MLFFPLSHFLFSSVHCFFLSCWTARNDRLRFYPYEHTGSSQLDVRPHKPGSRVARRGLQSQPAEIDQDVFDRDELAYYWPGRVASLPRTDHPPISQRLRRSLHSCLVVFAFHPISLSQQPSSELLIVTIPPSTPFIHTLYLMPDETTPNSGSSSDLPPSQSFLDIVACQVCYRDYDHGRTGVQFWITGCGHVLCDVHRGEWARAS